MKQILLDDVIKIDDKLISKGISINHRPLAAAIELKKSYYIKELGMKFEEDIMRIYNLLYPDQKFNFPNLLVGGVAFRDQFYIVRIPIIYGNIINFYDFIDIKRKELEIIYKYYPAQYQQAMYCVCDLYDIAYGIDDLCKIYTSEKSHWLRKVLSNIRATTFTLSENIDLDSVLQSSLLSIELAAKYCLLIKGHPEEYLRKKIGHNKDKIIQELSKLNFIENNFMKIYTSLPDYV
ncbi:hypothetical protein NMV37_01660 [Pasteurella multocida]|nr:hypothetical protein [Pasteurella multocida]MDY0525862.1 hypothetical protein [Pasteurella multocida]